MKFRDLLESTDIIKVAKELLKHKDINTAVENKDGLLDILIKSDGMNDSIGKAIKKAGMFIKHAYDGFSGDSFELAPIKDAKKYGVTINEVKQLDREDLEGLEADKLMRELEKNKNKKVQSKVDADGYQIDYIMTKEATYIVYYEYSDDDDRGAPMRIIKNPNKKDIKEYKDSL